MPRKKYGQANLAGKEKNMNAKTYLWNIFEVAREERTDGDHFEGDLGTAAACFVNGLGPDGKQYKCMEGLDKEALRAEIIEHEDRTAFINEASQLIQDHYKELAAAFAAGDRVAFEAILNE